METLKRLSSPVSAGLSCGLVLALASLWQTPEAAGDFSAPNGATGRPTTTVPVAYTVVATGEVDGNTSAEVCPTVACKLVRFKAAGDNTGSVFIGTSSSMTVKDGTTDTTTGFQLTAGQDTGWIPATNVNQFYHRDDNATDDFTYMALN